MASILERMASVETDLGAHKDQCEKDKGSLNDRLDAIDAKLWAGLAILALQFGSAAVYLAIKGPPWAPAQSAQVADRAGSG